MAVIIQYAWYIFLAIVIGGHLLFAYKQWFNWEGICEELTDLTRAEALKTAFLGRSFASYNACIGIGLLLGLLLESPVREWVHGVVLALIAVTAFVGALGTKGNKIRNFRLFPALGGLTTLVLLQFVQ